jgi:hypothetical protein
MRARARAHASRNIGTLVHVAVQNILPHYKQSHAAYNELHQVKSDNNPAMPRASWSGFLRLSLVSCPIYLSPATTRTKSIRLHQLWRPAAAQEPDADAPERDRDEQVASASRPQLVGPAATEPMEPMDQATRIALRPHDPKTGEEIEKSEIVKGYEYEAVRRVEEHSNGMPGICWQTIFIRGKPQ